MKMMIIVLTAIILFYNYGNDNVDDIQRHLAAFTIVLSWAELITLVGKHPRLSTSNLYVVMFYQVSPSMTILVLSPQVPALL